MSWPEILAYGFAIGALLVRSVAVAGRVEDLERRVRDLEADLALVRVLGKATVEKVLERMRN